MCLHSAGIGCVGLSDGLTGLTGLIGAGNDVRSMKKEMRINGIIFIIVPDQIHS
ncbi:hypothetical protein Bca4012_028021 [Brassica carinata]